MFSVQFFLFPIFNKKEKNSFPLEIEYKITIFYKKSFDALQRNYE